MDNKIEVKVLPCPLCGRYMADRRWKQIYEYRMVLERFDGWMKARGIVFNSDVTDPSDHEICEACKSEGKASFKCAMCNEIKSSSKTQESFGNPAEHLCIDCYNSVSAATWAAKVEELEHEHEYDFE